MQALTLAKDCYAMKLDLLSNATVVDRAIQFVKNHRDLHRSITDQNGNSAIEDPQKESVTKQYNLTESKQNT